MTQRGYPLWLLRDWTAFVAVLITFWTLIFAGFRAGRRAARGKRLSDLELQTLFQLYANAESRLDHAIWRQAWRAGGYSAKHAEFVQMPAPTNTQELETRFHGYQRALRDIEQLVVAYADDLRSRFNLSRAQVGDPNAVRTAPIFAHHAPAAFSRPASGDNGLSRRSTTKAEGGLSACARGPPPYSRLPIPHRLSATARLRTPAIVRTRTQHISATSGTRAPHYACDTSGTCC
jgi:hypothetical protein